MPSSARGALTRSWQPALACLCPLLLGQALGEATQSAFPASHTELSRTEADGFRRQFRQFDKDADGKITADELAGLAEAPPADAQQESRLITEIPQTPRAQVALRASARSQAAQLAAQEAQAPPASRSLPQGPPESSVVQTDHIQSRSAQPFFRNELAFVHVPSNLGQTIERAALDGNREEETPFISYGSFNAKSREEQWEQLSSVAGYGAQIWGTMYPDLRAVSNYTGCNLVYEPPKHWPAALSRMYFSGKRAFGLLRDPYDRLVSEFLYQASGGGKFADFKRSDVSEREGSLEREGPEYAKMYGDCDINGWVKEELRHFKAGDLYRGNCHLLPQAEYFEHPNGISLAIDTRTMPNSFNVEMERRGYTIRVRADSIRQDLSCNKLSVFDLDEEAKQLIREVYAADFELLCRHFGYCDNEELTCLAQIPFMCGSAASEPS